MWHHKKRARSRVIITCRTLLDVLNSLSISRMVLYRLTLIFGGSAIFAPTPSSPMSIIGMSRSFLSSVMSSSLLMRCPCEESHFFGAGNFYFFRGACALSSHPGATGGARLSVASPLASSGYCGLARVRADGRRMALNSVIHFFIRLQRLVHRQRTLAP